jgi:glucose-6-phosphate 1-dehydrogenase
VPFYLRAGKRLPRRVSEIAVTFKKVPHSIFEPITPEDLSSNVLVFNVQPKDGVSLVIQAKQPGPKLCMSSLAMQFNYREVFGITPPNAYERLLLDVMLGDQTLFVSDDYQEASWTLITPILEAWESDMEAPDFYPAGTWGPQKGEELLKRDGRYWRIP